ncbi:S49 family peptidase [Salinimicrobium sp. 3283s]|uniref:S49 family peptidase n=1 Tax=Salinimicrobium sp. 3283s TaxID=3114359 RepID=UPI0031E7AD50
MKVNALLQDLFRAQWLIDVHSIAGFAPIVQKIISGEELVLGNNGVHKTLIASDGSVIVNTNAILTLVDKNGRRVARNEEGGYEGIPKGTVAHVYMMGAVMKYGDWCTYGADEIVNAMRFANENENIKGIVFHVDGPGGAVSAIGPFLQFAKEKKKPVIGLVDAAMSLHYWAMVSVCDWIIADNDVSARFGSVGVMCTFQDTKAVYEKLGYKFHEIYPDESPHKNEAFRLALEGKYEMIKEEHLSPTAKKFQGAVRAGRPNLKEEVGVLTGKTFTADQSLEYGMIDAIGSLQDALAYIDVMLDLKNFTQSKY